MQKIKRFFLKVLLLVIVLAIVSVLMVMTISNQVMNRTEDDIAYVVTGEVKINPVSLNRLHQFDADCILVLGAGIKDPETPSDMLKDRLDVGIELYKQGVAPKILLSGDNPSSPNINGILSRLTTDSTDSRRCSSPPTVNG